MHLQIFFFSSALCKSRRSQLKRYFSSLSVFNFCDLFFDIFSMSKSLFLFSIVYHLILLDTRCFFCPSIFLFSKDAFQKLEIWGLLWGLSPLCYVCALLVKWDYNYGRDGKVLSKYLLALFWSNLDFFIFWQLAIDGLKRLNTYLCEDNSLLFKVVLLNLIHRYTWPAYLAVGISLLTGQQGLIKIFRFTKHRRVVQGPTG